MSRYIATHPKWFCRKRMFRNTFISNGLPTGEPASIFGDHERVLNLLIKNKKKIKKNPLAYTAKSYAAGILFGKEWR